MNTASERREGRRVLAPVGTSDGDQVLARYVCEKALAKADLDVLATPDQGLDATEKDRWAVQASFDLLRSLGISQALDPRVLMRNRQPVRDPHGLLVNGVGNCLDLSVTLATLILKAGGCPHIAIGHGHAFVLVPPGARDELDWPASQFPQGGTSTEGAADGVRRVENEAPLREAAATEEIIAIEALALTKPGLDLRDAVEQGRERIRRGVRLVDVRWLQEQGIVVPLEPPIGYPRVAPYFPGGDTETTRDYPTRLRVRKHLESASGTVVLTGDSGTGKSTLARVAARSAPHASGWFLDGSGPQGLIDSLAQAELWQRNRRNERMDDQEREGYAYSALRRLALANHGWVVVIDNANGDPRDLRPFLPEPGPDQLLIVTTTNPKWNDFSAEDPVLLDLLTDEDLKGFDPELRALIAGLPLLSEGFRRFIEADGTSKEMLLEAFDGPDMSEGAGPGALWSSIESLLGPRERDLCVLASLLPPNHLPKAPLERISGASPGVLERLNELGLTTWDPESEIASLHRLFGETIRQSAQGAELDLALSLCADPEMIAVFDRQADRETLDRLAQILLDGREQGSPVARALHQVASVMELKGNTSGSARLYEVAERVSTEAIPLSRFSWSTVSTVAPARSTSFTRRMASSSSSPWAGHTTARRSSSARDVRICSAASSLCRAS